MECPHCGLVSPASATRCDCGFDFISKTLERSYLKESLGPRFKQAPAIAPREPWSSGVDIRLILFLVVMVGVLGVLFVAIVESRITPGREWQNAKHYRALREKAQGRSQLSSAEVISIMGKPETIINPGEESGDIQRLRPAQKYLLWSTGCEPSIAGGFCQEGVLEDGAGVDTFVKLTTKRVRIEKGK
jgi:hypothetical protein